ncbi:phage major tail protein, TP901-1 family [Terribacillus saccharophilus]|uniref:phage major tail protein, TP901-1 family n=1 Tax=Terribacillus saccharophilus TaxID=361277 RepID=UPI000BA6D2C5|nr:phage major tail protein, TP901-1 family [Terribacillus saccharophilus]PAF19754.1 phage major tail protein, TP901-1 family [Terribacillus saccharophilus]
MARSGKKSIIIVQSVRKELGDGGELFGQLSEHTHSKENELIDEQTKFGRILAYGNTSESFEITAYYDPSDAGQGAVADALDNEEQIKIWEVNTELNANGKHDAIFAYCLVENSDKDSAGDGLEEFSSTLQVINKSQKGELDPLPPEMLNFGQYGFETPGETGAEPAAGA